MLIKARRKWRGNQEGHVILSALLFGGESLKGVTLLHLNQPESDLAEGGLKRTNVIL